MTVQNERDKAKGGYGADEVVEDEEIELHPEVQSHSVAGQLDNDSGSEESEDLLEWTESHDTAAIRTQTGLTRERMTSQCMRV
jgi:hypothetical protein